MELSDARLRPDAVITLGEWTVVDTGERVELSCVVMREPGRTGRDDEAVDIVRQELPAQARDLARWVLEVWREERLSGP